MRKVAKYLVQNFDPKQVQSMKVRGRLNQEVKGLRSIRERQQASANFTNKAKSAKYKKMLVKALLDLQIQERLQKNVCIRNCYIR
jgi:hypothetical protein